MTATYRKFAHYTTHRVARWRHAWEVTDGIGGPVLLSGRRLTRRGAEKAAANAAATCEPWVEPEPEPEPVHLDGVCRCDRPVLHPLDRVEAYKLTRRLQLDEVPVTVQVPTEAEDLVVLFPALALTTRQQVHAMRVVKSTTDAPVRWAGVA